jgi:outer membrane protein OmpA-like peptidoglycan-associated protein
MRKRCLLALAFVLMLSFSGYAQSDSKDQSDSKGSFFFSGGVYNGLFPTGQIVPISNFEIKKLFAAIASLNYEFPVGAGNIALGLEGGYSSGSRFGGIGGVDFIPIGLNAAYVFPLTSFFYVGPRLKLGGLGLLGDRSGLLPLAGARLEAELRSKGFPLGLFVAGGIELFPFAPELAMLPVVEAGLRFPRGKFTWPSSSNAAKNKEPAGTAPASSRDDLTSQTVTTAGTTTGTVGSGTNGSGTVSTGAGTTASQGTTTGAGTTGSGTVGTGAGTTSSQGTTTTGTGTAGTATGTVGSGTGTGAGAGTGSTTSGSATAGSATAGSGIAGVAQGQNRNIVLENGKQGILNSIYFEPDTAVLIETYRPIIESVGRQLAADSSLKLEIRAYAALFGTADGRYAVSLSRARFSRDFLNTQYGISVSRFTIEAFGAEKAPVYATADWQSHRCVELIMYRD